jgi:hypothetical protein
MGRRGVTHVVGLRTTGAGGRQCRDAPILAIAGCEGCRTIGPMSADTTNLPDDSIVLVRCDLPGEPVPLAFLAGVGNPIRRRPGVTLTRCTLAAAWQRIESLLRTRVRDTRSVAKVPTAVINPGSAAGENCLALLHFASVSGCTLEDALPSGGGTLTISHSARPV